MVQVSRPLYIKKEVPLDYSRELINSLDVAMAEHYCKNKDFEKGLKMYRDVFPMLPDKEKNEAINKYITFAMQHAQAMSNEKQWAEAIEVYRDLMKLLIIRKRDISNFRLIIQSLLVRQTVVG